MHLLGGLCSILAACNDPSTDATDAVASVDAPGTYPYHCGEHPNDPLEVGVITVTAP